MTILIASCAQLLPSGELPTRLVVLPRGERVKGRDGRAWSLKDETAVLAQLATTPVLLDENHASVHAAPRGARSPAAGWLSDFKFTDAGLEAQVDWTPYGAELFSKKAYRYLSPALTYDQVGATPDTQGTIRGLHSVGLTNHPNLDLPALNAQDPENMTPEQIKALTDALSGAIASGFQAISAQLAAKLEVKDAPVAPNADSAATVKVAVNAVVESAVAAGKIAPASKDAFVAMGGETAASLALLQTTIAAMPALVGVNSIEKPKDAPAELSAAQKLICKNLGITEEQFRSQPAGRG